MKLKLLGLFWMMVANSAFAAGYVESASYPAISGWACLPQSPLVQVEVVAIRDDGLRLNPATVIASNFREDAVRAACGGGTSAHGFSFDVQIAPGNFGYLDGQVHAVHVYLQVPGGGRLELTNSPAQMLFSNNGINGLGRLIQICRFYNSAELAGTPFRNLVLVNTENNDRCTKSPVPFPFDDNGYVYQDLGALPALSEVSVCEGSRPQGWSVSTKYRDTSRCRGMVWPADPLPNIWVIRKN